MIQVYSNVNGVAKDITKLCKSINMSGTTGDVSRKLDCTFLKAMWNNNRGSADLESGTILHAYLDLDEKFRGIVVERNPSSEEEMPVSALDYLFYFNKSKITHKFQNTTAESATMEIIKELEVSPGDIATTGISLNRLIKQKSAYQAIMELYTQINKQTGQKFYMVMDKNLVCVRELGSLAAGSIENGKNLLKYSFKDSIQDVINRVKIYDENSNYVNTVENSESVLKLGVLQDVYEKEQYKDSDTVSKKMLKEKTKELTVEILGNYDYTTGKAVIVTIDEEGINKEKMYITGDTHTWDIETGNYTTSLTLLWENNMDIQEGDDTSE